MELRDSIFDIAENEMKTKKLEFSGETNTSSSGVSTVQGKEWVNEILMFAKQNTFFEQFAYVKTAKKGNKDVALPIITSNLTFTSFSTEATVRTKTEITNINAVVFTPAPVKYGAVISDEVVETTQVDMFALVRDQLGYQAAYQIDASCATAIAAASPAATIYGGDATGTTSLESGDVLTPALINKAQRYLKQNGWINEKSRPFVAFIPSVCEEALMNDSQFTNASEYGGNEIVMNGEIGKYLGVKIISTEQCPSATTWGSGALSGHTCFVLKAKVSYGIVYRKEPQIETEYKKDEGMYCFYLNMAYMADSLQDKAIVLIKVSDE